MSDYDVAVVGGGPAGVGAAVGAARRGRSVVLIEAEDVLGGAGTVALVNNFCNAYWDGDRFVIGGVFGELRHRLQGRKAIWTTRGPDGEGKAGQEAYDPDAYADELVRLCESAGADLRPGRRCVGADFGRPTELELSGGDEREHVSAEVVVDATGDAVLADRAGVPTRMADELQPLTYCYAFGPVDLDALGEVYPGAIQYDENVGVEYGLPSYVDEVCELVREDVADGRLDLPVPTLYCTMSIPGREQYMTTNFGHVEVDDPTDPEAMARATEEGRRQMREGIEWFRDRLPGFERVEVVEHPRRIGVRESRRIAGEYELTAEDVVTRRQFDDAIAQCCFNIDIHTADADPDHSGGIEGASLHDREHYDVPWRALVPADGPDNLLVAGRSISATHEAMASFRVSPSVMAIGEAAGVGAALAADGTAVDEVDAGAVQERLRAAGAILE